MQTDDQKRETLREKITQRETTIADHRELMARPGLSRDGFLSFIRSIQAIESELGVLKDELRSMNVGTKWAAQAAAQRESESQKKPLTQAEKKAIRPKCMTNYKKEKAKAN